MFQNFGQETFLEFFWNSIFDYGYRGYDLAYLFVRIFFDDLPDFIKGNIIYIVRFQKLWRFFRKKTSCFQ